MHRKAERTEFGEALARFMFENNLPMTVVAKECDVSYESLRSAVYGRSPGHAVIPKVEAYIEQYKKELKGA